MKKKYLKKMLAIALAAMTVSATPDLVGAVSEKSKETIKKFQTRIKNEKLDEQATTNMLNELEKIAKEDLDNEDKMNVANITKDISNLGLLKKSSLNDVLTLLDQCSSGKYSKDAVTLAITSIADHGLLKKNSLEKVLTILGNCSNNEDTKERVARTIHKIASQGLLKKNSLEKVLTILENCSNNNDAKYYIDHTIREMTLKNLFDKCSTNQIHQVTELLIGFLGDNTAAKNDNYDDDFSYDDYIEGDYGLGDEFTHPTVIADHALTTVKAMAQKGLLNQCTPNHIQQIVDSVIEHLADYENLNDAVDLFNTMSENKSLDLYQLNNIHQTVGNLIGHLRNDNIKEYATSIIAAMAKKGLLNQCEPNQLHQILDLLRAHLEDYLADGNMADYLDDENNRNYEMVDKIFDVSLSCSESQNNKTKLKAMEIIERLAYELNTSREDSRNEAFEEEEASEEEASEEKETFKEKLFNRLSDKAPEIATMLETYSTINAFKFRVTHAMLLLIPKKVFNSLTKVQSSKLINAINNCLKYTGKDGKEKRLTNTLIEGKNELNNYIELIRNDYSSEFLPQDKPLIMVWAIDRIIKDISLSKFDEKLSDDGKQQFKEISNELENFRARAK